MPARAWLAWRQALQDVVFMTVESYLTLAPPSGDSFLVTQRGKWSAC